MSSDELVGERAFCNGLGEDGIYTDDARSDDQSCQLWEGSAIAKTEDQRVGTYKGQVWDHQHDARGSRQPLQRHEREEADGQLNQSSAQVSLRQLVAHFDHLNADDHASQRLSPSVVPLDVSTRS